MTGLLLAFLDSIIDPVASKGRQLRQVNDVIVENICQSNNNNTKDYAMETKTTNLSHIQSELEINELLACAGIDGYEHNDDEIDCPPCSSEPEQRTF